MTRLSIKALRIYDARGLLRPASVDSATGYRYYVTEQLRRAEIIRVLRSVEMPLDEIRTLLDDPSGDESARRLLRHRERLAARLQQQERMLAFLESLIRTRELAMPYEIEIIDCPERAVASIRVRTNLREIGNHIGTSFGTLMRVLSDNDLRPAGPPLTVYHEVIDQETDGDIEVCIPLQQVFAGTGDVRGRQLEGGAVATTTHTGPYEEISPAYHALTEWIAGQGYEIAGPPREIYLNDPQEVAPDALLTRLEYPVHSAG